MINATVIFKNPQKIINNLLGKEVSISYKIDDGRTEDHTICEVKPSLVERFWQISFTDMPFCVFFTNPQLLMLVNGLPVKNVVSVYPSRLQRMYEKLDIKIKQVEE